MGKYQRRHTSDTANAILKTLMDYHGCAQHAGPDSGVCKADMMRTDLVMDVLTLPEDSGNFCACKAYFRVHKHNPNRGVHEGSPCPDERVDPLSRVGA